MAGSRFDRVEAGTWARGGGIGGSPRHFKRMLKDTYDKLGVANRTQALIRAMQLGLMDDD